MLSMVNQPFKLTPEDRYEGTGDLTVHVENNNGKPVAGKEVKLIDPDTGEIVASAKTDANGTVVFENIEKGEYEIRIDDNTKSITLTNATQSVTLDVIETPPKSYRPLEQ